MNPWGSALAEAATAASSRVQVASRMGRFHQVTHEGCLPGLAGTMEQDDRSVREGFQQGIGDVAMKHGQILAGEKWKINQLLNEFQPSGTWGTKGAVYGTKGTVALRNFRMD